MSFQILTIVKDGGSVRRCGWRTGSRRARGGTGGCPTGGRCVAHHVNLLLFLLVLQVGTAFRPRIRLPLFGHQAARHRGASLRDGDVVVVVATTEFLSLGWLGRGLRHCPSLIHNQTFTWCSGLDKTM